MRPGVPGPGAADRAAARIPMRRPCIPAVTAWSLTVDATSVEPEADDPRNSLAEPQIHRPRCLRQAQARRCPAPGRQATLHAHRKLLWWIAIPVMTPRARRPSIAVPTLW